MSRMNLYVDPKLTGENISELMTVNHIKMRNIMDACDFKTPQTIYKWLKGDCVPSIDNLVILAAMFKCRIEDFVAVRRL